MQILRLHFVFAIEYGNVSIISLTFGLQRIIQEDRQIKINSDKY